MIVTAQGALQPDSEVRRFYAPVDGELANLYIAEGQPVSKGDVLARLNARGAIEAATNAQQAQLKLEDAEREWRAVPGEEGAARAQGRDPEAGDGTGRAAAREARSPSAPRKLAQAQRAQVDEARTNLEEARRARDAARAEAEKFERVFATPGGGGISQLQLDAKKNALQAAENAQRGCAIEARRAQRPAEPGVRAARAQVETSGQELSKLRLQYEAATNELATPEEKLRLQLQTARLAADAAARVRFENIDKDNFLLILAPVSGVITDVTSTQPGDKIQANTPLGGIAPSDARPVLRIEIAEQDRAFLREGLPVKLKFSAFPYQRYGLINGRLEYISPATKPSPQTKQPVYEGARDAGAGPLPRRRQEVPAALRHDGDRGGRGARAAPDRSRTGSFPPDRRMSNETRRSD